MNNNMALIIISGEFYMFLITLLIISTFLFIKHIIKKKRIKKMYYFLTEGYEVITTDKDGIAVFMKKGGNYEQV